MGDRNDDIELAPARDVFRQWMRRWDYLADGMPDQPEVDELLRNILRAGQKSNASEIIGKPRS